MKKTTGYILLLTIGFLGAHRFYAKRPLSGSAIAGIYIIQLLIILGTFMDPLSGSGLFYFWPPYPAFQNLHALLDLLLAVPLPENASSQMVEDEYVRPAMWMATLPSLLIMVWLLIDCAFPKIWEKRNAV